MRNLGLAALFTLSAMILPQTDAGDVLDRVLARSTQARNNAAAAKDSVNEIRARVRDGATALTDKVRALIEEKVGEFKQFVKRRDEFVSSDRCQNVRGELIRILEGMDRIADLVQNLTEYCPSANRLIDFQAQIELVERIPCGAMLPLASIELPPCLADQLQDAAQALDLLQLLLDESDRLERGAEPQTQEGDVKPLAAFGAEVAACDLWLEHYGAARRAQGELEKLSMQLWLLGKVLDAVGETEIEANIGVHGYAIATLSDNPLKKWAGYVGAVNSVLGQVVTKVDGKLSRCVDQSVQDQILRNQAEILRNQELLLQGQ